MGEGTEHHVPAIIPSRKRHSNHHTGGWVGPRVGLDGCRKSRSHWDSIPRLSSP